MVRGLFKERLYFKIVGVLRHLIIAVAVLSLLPSTGIAAELDLHREVGTGGTFQIMGPSTKQGKWLWSGAYKAGLSKHLKLSVESHLFFTSGGDERDFSFGVSLIPLLYAESHGIFIQAGVGPSFFNKEHGGISPFEFQDRLGLGIRQDALSLGISFTHFSNSFFSDRSDGVDLTGFFISVAI